MRLGPLGRSGAAGAGAAGADDSEAGRRSGKSCNDTPLACAVCLDVHVSCLKANMPMGVSMS